ncbi:hypothetical protein [Methylobacterium sp. P1-11]|jgi:hypothetical protein|uniref:hypothetical protein n=1 Tax=Methylobacterium sp. P1-11 TaxID=2024616 RepID=UPI00156788CD|nr:hypothetical protein [Methylobacterium sp. P1-11]
MAWTKQGNLKGPRGVTWFTGTGAPTTANTTGSITGDLYLDLSTGDIYVLS